MRRWETTLRQQICGQHASKLQSMVMLAFFFLHNLGQACCCRMTSRQSNTDGSVVIAADDEEQPEQRHTRKRKGKDVQLANGQPADKRRRQRKQQGRGR
jgi:hypothetical protein